MTPMLRERSCAVSARPSPPSTVSKLIARCGDCWMVGSVLLLCGRGALLRYESATDGARASGSAHSMSPRSVSPSGLSSAVGDCDLL